MLVPPIYKEFSYCRDAILLRYPGLDGHPRWWCHSQFIHCIPDAVSQLSIYVLLILDGRGIEVLWCYFRFHENVTLHTLDIFYTRHCGRPHHPIALTVGLSAQHWRGITRCRLLTPSFNRCLLLRHWSRWLRLLPIRKSAMENCLMGFEKLHALRSRVPYCLQVEY